MAFRIAHQGPDLTPKAKPKKEATYLDFIRELPCVVTGKYGVEAAHVSYSNPTYGSYGRGKGTKVSDRWTLPLSPEQHRIQHSMNEAEFYEDRGINPHLISLIIYGLWTEHKSAALPFATAVIMRGVTERMGQ